MALGEAVDAIDDADARDRHAGVAHRHASRAPRRRSRPRSSSEPLLIAAALIVVYIILGMLYESFIHPLTILSTLPSAGLGALLASDGWSAFDLSVIALIGIILLIGIVKKNGIMMVDFAIAARARRASDAEDAIRQACLLRFRPILMTTMAAMLGGVPLMLGPAPARSCASRSATPWSAACALSQVLTLYTTPVVYLYLDRFQQWLNRAMGVKQKPQDEGMRVAAE